LSAAVHRSVTKHQVSEPGRARLGGLVTLALCIASMSCSSKPLTRTDAEYEEEIVASMHQLLLVEVKGLHQSAVDLQAALPTTVGRGWDASDQDQDAINGAKASWMRMRFAWERAEGTFAALFPDIDGALDSRYEDMLPESGEPPDTNPFDGEGVIGMHAVERILYAAEVPAAVVMRESVLTGYQAAAWPSTAAQAADMKSGLCERLVKDTQRLVDGWEPQAIELSDVFKGLTGLVDAQQEKVSLAADHEEESRYAQSTMADLRSNLAGTRAIYNLFIPWLATKSYGTALDHDAQLAFDRLQQTYDSIQGDALPEPPATWNSAQPSVEDQRSVFGKLFVAVVQEGDANRPGSCLHAMNQVSKALNLPQPAR
jgi:iron uptake system component EfeO